MPKKVPKKWSKSRASVEVVKGGPEHFFQHLPPNPRFGLSLSEALFFALSQMRVSFATSLNGHQDRSAITRLQV